MNEKLRALAIEIAQVRTGKPINVEFGTSADMQDALRAEFATLICKADGRVDFHKWNQNKNIIFQIMAEMIDVIYPSKMQKVFQPFAEVMYFNHGDKPRFWLKKGKKNVKRFITRVANAGLYERVRLDRDYFDVETYAHGGAVYQTLEGFLAGREDITEVLNILLEALEDTMYEDLVVALEGTIAQMPAANKHSHNAFSATEFNRVINTVRAYGSPSILCTIEFANTLTVDAQFTSDADKMDMRNQGYLGRWNGVPVILIPQTFTDETNTVKAINPKIAYIIPSGGPEAPIKMAFEGDTLLKQTENADWSVEIQIYKKMGLTIVHTNHFGAYENTALA